MLLVFTDPGCVPCTALLPQVAEWQRDPQSSITIALISRGSVDDNRAKASEHGASRMFIESDDEVSSLLRGSADPERRPHRPGRQDREPPGCGEPEIRSLVESALAAAGRLNVVVAGSPRPTEIEIGQPAPDLELTDLGGEAVSLRAMIEADTMLLFWNPDCGFCAQALE